MLNLPRCLYRHRDGLSGKQLGAVDFIEAVMLSAKLAIDSELSQLFQRRINLFLPQHFEHIPHSLA